MGHKYATEWGDSPPDEIELVLVVGGVADQVCRLSRGDTDPEWWAAIIACLSEDMNDMYKFWRPVRPDESESA